MHSARHSARKPPIVTNIGVVKRGTRAAIRRTRGAWRGVQVLPAARSLSRFGATRRGDLVEHLANDAECGIGCRYPAVNRLLEHDLLHVIGGESALENGRAEV